MISNTSATNLKFVRTRPGWVYWVRKPIFIISTLILLVAYAFFLLPTKSSSPEYSWISISVFVVLVLAWCANIFVDPDKPEILKGVVAFALIAVMCWMFYQFSGAKWVKLQKSFFNWSIISTDWKVLFSGLGVTLELAALSAVFSLVIGLVVAILRTLGSKTLNLYLEGYIDVFRSAPMIVIMVVIFFALPYVGINFGSIVTTVLGLSLGYGAYTSEVFRAGIESVHCGQVEASRALGMTHWQALRLVILPQAIPVVIPPMTGILVSMLKDTAVASLVASPELLKRARELYTSKANPTPLVAASLIYLVVLIPLVRISNMLEGRFKKSQ
jgi:polar amino acid transport system permease protein